MNRKMLRTFFAVSIAFATMTSCSKDSETEYIDIWKGYFTSASISKQHGFPDYRDSLLKAVNVERSDFVRISTDSAWALSKSDQTKLLTIRNNVHSPGRNTLLSKIIPLTDLNVYMNNEFGGLIGGFVAIASDVKELHTMKEVFWGMRLDYPETAFSEDGAGYAVIRFYSNHTDKLDTPLCSELGGTYDHSWPNTGGGFVASTLGEGGLPEYIFTGYYAPEEGAELYEVTPKGNEILRSRFKGGKWVTFDPENATRTIGNNVGGKAIEGKNVTYNGHEYMLRGVSNGMATLTSFEKFVDHKQIERGLWAIEVPESEIAVK